MPMSRKHYEAIARVIADAPEDGSREHIAKELATVLKADNSSFNRGRFLSACKVEPS